MTQALLDLGGRLSKEGGPRISALLLRAREGLRGREMILLTPLIFLALLLLLLVVAYVDAQWNAPKSRLDPPPRLRVIDGQRGR